MKRLALALVALMLAGCGGGGGSSSVAPANTQAKTQAGSVVLAIPTRAPTSGKIRYPQFVSPNAVSVGISVNGAAAQFFDVSATSALCVTSGTGVRTCTLPFSAPFGSDTFTITIYAGATGTGAVLATATSINTVVAGTPFSFTVAMNAIIGTIIANIPSTASASCPNGAAFPGNLGITEGCTGNGTLTVVVDDPSGAQVTGSAPYASPIQLSTNDPSVTPSPVQITAPGQTSVFTYSGVAFGAAITNSLTVSLTVGSQSVPLAIPVQRQYLYVANGTFPPTIPAGGGNVAVYTFGSGAGALPVRVIAGANTLLSDPVVPLLDAAGNLYVLDNGVFTGTYAPAVLVFAPGANGNVAPIRQISAIASVGGTNACESMILDPTGKYLFVLCDFFDIYVFPVGTNGTAVANLSAELSSDNFNQVLGEGFDAAGNLYVPDISQNVVWEFAGPIPPTVTNESMAPMNTLSGPAGSWPLNAGVAPVGIGFDKPGNLYASIVNTGAAGPADVHNEIGIWQAHTIPCNDCAQSGYLLGGALANHAPALLTLDGAGNLYVSNPVTNQVLVFAAATVASAGNPTNNPAVLHTIGTAAAPNGPVGLAVGP